MRTENLVIGSMVLGQRYTPTPARLSFFRELEAHLPEIHGMTSYAIADTVPLLPGGNAFRLFAGIEVQGRPRVSEGTGGNVSVRSVTEQYFSTLGIPIRRGRSFEPSDRTGNPNVVIVSELLARRLFRDEDPLGKQMRWNSDDPWRTIVGVVATVKNNPVLSASDDPEFYVPHPQGASRRIVLVIRTPLPASAISDSIRSAVAAVDPALPVTVETMNAYVRRLSDRPRFTAMLLAFFSSAAILLAGVGLFGVIAFLVARRTQEIGVRMALGASSRSIVMLVLSHTMRWTLLGILLGLCGAFFVSYALRNLLFQVSERDLPTFAVTVVWLGAMTIIAAWIPSRRASRIDPMAALRQD
jgi:predicted permease